MCALRWEPPPTIFILSSFSAETIDQVPPVVRSNLGIGFVPHEMLYGSPEFTGIYPITLEEPITPRSIYLFQRKNQPLSIAAKHLRQMLLAPTEESDN